MTAWPLPDGPGRRLTGSLRRLSDSEAAAQWQARRPGLDSDSVVTQPECHWQPRSLARAATAVRVAGDRYRAQASLSLSGGKFRLIFKSEALPVNQIHIMIPSRTP